MARTTRRAFLKTLAGGVAVTATGYVALGELHYLPGWAFPWNSHPQSFTVSVVRPDDFVYLDFEFVNLYLSATANSANLVKFASPAYIIVTFPPQSVAEQAFYEVPASNYSQQDGNGNPLTSGEPGYEPNPSSGETPTSRPVDSVIAGTSRVVFVVPSSVDTIKYTLDSLLSAISTYDMNVVPVALPPPTSLIVLNQKTTTSTSQPSISAPDVDETAIEVPFRLIVSPHQYERWAHATDPVTHGVSTELWHSRLASGLITDGVLDETVPSYMRAVWSPDFASLSSLPPHYSPNTSYTLPGTTPFVEFRSGLDARDRSEIVHLSSDFGIAHYEPATVTVNRLMLSSLGAWLSADAAWSPPSPLEVEAWNHVSTMARDHYVRVVYAGYLFPFGHSASLVKITERRFDPAPESNSVSSQTAYLRQRMFIVVREPVVGYPSPGMQHSGRKFPFTSLKVTTTVTPDLDDPTQSEAYSGQGQDAFWPRVSGQDFRFHCVGTDSDGQRSEFTVPMIFIGDSIAVPQDGTHQGILNSIIQKYGSSGPERVEPDMAGQRVALAQSHTAGDTSFETQFADLEAEPKDPNAPVPPSDQPQFYPAFADAGLRIPAVAQLTPNATPPQGQSQVLATTTVSFPDLYLANGFNSSNVGEVFAQIAASDQIPLDFSQDANNSGGIVTPSLNIVGLSRMSGLLGGLPNLNDADLASYINQLGAGTFDPSSFFNQVDAKILGGIPLTDILNAGTVGQGPKMVSHVIYQNNDPTMQPIAFETNISWDASALLKADPTGTFEPSHSSLTLQAVIHTDLTANPTTTFQITSTLTNFAVHLIPSILEFLVISFNSLEFNAQSGKKVDVTASIKGVQFAGPLEFINELENYIPLDGLSDPPTIDVTAQGVTVGYTLAVPSIGVGVFSLENISLGVQLTLPFTSDPARVRFSFSEREHPFLLTVSLFAGGGFFATALGLDGVEILEGSLEFGGNFSLDLGVASGGVYALAGIYFKLDNSNGSEQATLTGFYQVGGSLEILGLVTLEEQFYLGLTYDNTSNDVYGQATVTVEISIAFFSESVSLSVEKTFGHSTPPTFSDLIGQQDWLAYTQAFAFGGP